MAKLKHKKEQIVKLHNRKKEIELMKSIENEKHKLRLIQHKQEELNKYLPYPETTLKDIHTNTPHNKVININTASTLKNNTQRIYNVDDKKTKKNNLLMKDVKDVIDVVKTPIIIKKSNPINPMIEPSLHTLDIKNTKLKEHVKKENIIKEEVKNEEEIIKAEVKNEEEIIKAEVKKEEDKKEHVKNEEKIIKADIKKEEVKKKNFNNQPYHYYCKRDIKKYNLDVYWGTKEELYTTDKMTETLTMYLDIPPLFNHNCTINSDKDTKSLEEKIKILKKDYKCKNLSHFCKDNLIELLYKIYSYDLMTIEIKYK